MKTRQKYSIHSDILVEYGHIPLLPTCNGFTIKNIGTTNVVIMQDIIVPGDSKAFGGNQDELCTLNEEINFQVPVPPPGTITNAALITQKYFID